MATRKKPAEKKAARRKKRAPKKTPPDEKTAKARPLFSAEEREKFRKLLEAERARLTNTLRGSSDADAYWDAGSVGDIIDAASTASSQFLARGVAETEGKNLKEVEAALARIEEGTFGVCVRCGKAVERARLEAIPWAPTCIACRREEERRR